jgi:hypothetical protein
MFGNSIFVPQYRNRNERHDVFERGIIIGLTLHPVVISHFRNIPIVLLEAQWHYGVIVTYSCWDLKCTGARLSPEHKD